MEMRLERSEETNLEAKLVVGLTETAAHRR